MALPLAIFAIVVIGALLAGAYFASSQENKIGSNMLVEQRSFNVAEFGLHYDVSNWDPARNIEGHFPVGSTQPYVHYYNDNNDMATVSVTRLTPATYLVVSAGQANVPNAASLAVRRTSMMVQLAYPSIKMRGAMMSGGFVKLSGSAGISGYDQDPPDQGTDCSTYTDSSVSGVSIKPPVRSSTGKIVTSYFSKSGGDSISSSTPPPASDGSFKGVYTDANTTIVDTSKVAGDTGTYTVYGTETWASLRANAKRLPGDSTSTTTIAAAPSLVTGGTACNTSDPANWGQINHVNTPEAPNAFASCMSYYPIIYAPGNLTLSGGTGQGILLVEKSLTLNGDFTFNGIIIVHNDLNKSNGSVKISGGIMVANAAVNCTVTVVNGSNQCVDGTTVTGNFALRYSKCSVENALRGSAILIPVKQRAWAQLY